MIIQDNPVGIWWFLFSLTTISVILQTHAWFDARVQGLIISFLALLN